ncbi:MAG: 16S rRNA (cytidine(1402)-2'-O)-methyltransferase [Anaerolineae bacterium]|nr:16S rRNA (cytidine(1402)-2'-O)-methyltransferase [Anaerolineae bacterium]
MLYLVSTPIGNLGDITLRALQVFKDADFVVSEDTRHTGILLQHFEIKKPQISFYEQNKEKALPRILSLLQEGKNVAMVTDAGSPGISDPGYLLVRAAVEAGIEMTAIPGATAVIPALVLSGLPVHSFTFRGFPPHKGGPRKRFLAVDAESPHTLVYYESPYRLVKTLGDAMAVFGDRPAAIANDLTKKFELVRRGMLSELIKWQSGETPRGEYTIVIAGKDARL